MISAGSGSDVFTENLINGLHKLSISADIKLIPRWSGFYPPLAKKHCFLSNSDIIHANTWNGFGFNSDHPLVVTEHHVVHDKQFLQYTSFAQRIFYKGIYQYEKKSLNCAEAVTAVSRFTQKKIEETFGYSNSVLIYNGIDISLFRPLQLDNPCTEKEQVKLLYVGNHLKRKGFDLLEPIMKSLGDKFHLYTTTGLRSKNEAQCSNISALGKLSIKELISAYNKCDILLFPSRLEGFGLCVAEAMACGKPVVTTNGSSLPELVEQDKGGILCNIDDIKNFSNSIRYLAEDENLRIKMGKFNRQRVIDRFNLDKMASSYKRLYESIY